MKKMKKLNVLLLALVMVFALMPMRVKATNLDTGVALYQVNFTIQNDMLEQVVGSDILNSGQTWRCTSCGTVVTGVLGTYFCQEAWTLVPAIVFRCWCGSWTRILL